MPGFVQSDPEAGGRASLQFPAARKLRRIDIEGPTPFLLRINGQSVGIARPGENTFDPPLYLDAGDTFQLELLEQAVPADHQPSFAQAARPQMADTDMSTVEEVRHE